MKISGIGAQTSAINPRREDPHPYPNFAYIIGPARGKTAATTDRRTVLAAMADAAYTVYTSIR